ncbi:WD40-repeat-containing domain protein [Polychytrium aggregatum]|uniref:WD40-repeat-containing domain protein n=1 Tax=Polychytrium aggregatum TaxID=110093 RepID=UPI0022FE34C4|nr:WD40-repeat-containing domain protein [Polychytrium aggregatum]KAI9206361.1 WD40-repeat-containing domain protein [Polychytrium aggregatum]
MQPQGASQHQQPHNGAAEVVLASAGYDHTIRFWEALSGICLRTIPHPDSQVNRLAISHDKRLLGAAGNPHVRLYDVQANNPNAITSFDGHTGNITSIAFQSAGRWVVTGSEDGTIKIWDVRAPGVQRNYTLSCAVNDVIIHPNQGELISCDQSGHIKIWDLGENACSHELMPEEDIPARSVTMASDGSMLIAANNKGNIYAWKMKNKGDMSEMGQPVQIPAHKKFITKCLLSPDTRSLATCSADHTVALWDTNHLEAGAKEPSKTLKGHGRWVWDCAFSADSAYLVTGSSDHSARLWDLTTGETIRHYNGHQKAVVCIALHDVSL